MATKKRASRQAEAKKVHVSHVPVHQGHVAPTCADCGQAWPCAEAQWAAKWIEEHPTLSVVSRSDQ